jgi:hypothetical protein
MCNVRHLELRLERKGANVNQESILLAVFKLNFATNVRDPVLRNANTFKIGQVDARITDFWRPQATNRSFFSVYGQYLYVRGVPTVESLNRLRCNAFYVRIETIDSYDLIFD